MTSCLHEKRTVDDMGRSRKYGKQARIERARERIERAHLAARREYDLGYDVEEGTICLACALKAKGERFMYETAARDVELDCCCALCGLTFRKANTEEVFRETLCIVTL